MLTKSVSLTLTLTSVCRRTAPDRGPRPTLSEYRCGRWILSRALGDFGRGKRPTFLLQQLGNLLLFPTDLFLFLFPPSCSPHVLLISLYSFEDFFPLLVFSRADWRPYEKVLNFLTASRGSCLFFPEPTPPTLLPKWICKDRWVIPEGTLLWKRLGSEQLNKIRKFKSHSNLPGSLPSLPRQVRTLLPDLYRSLLPSKPEKKNPGQQEPMFSFYYHPLPNILSSLFMAVCFFLTLN